MSEEKTGVWLWHTDHISGNLWQIFRNGKTSDGGNPKALEVITST